MNRETSTGQATRSAFDAAASVYDREYEKLHGIQRLREIMWQEYLRYFSAGDNLLEINCGTGTDALFLAQKGMHVLATDTSPNMIAAATAAFQEAHLDHRAAAQQLSYLDLDGLGDRLFDGTYSNMGGLNCTNDIPTVAAGLAAHLKPGGCFIATVMPRFCLWETAVSLLRGNRGMAFRRRKPGGVQASLHGGRVQTYYYSPQQFVSLFSPFFEFVSLKGLNIFTPPPNSTSAYASLPGLIRTLERLDDLIAGFRLLSSIGDHYLIVLRRKAGGELRT
jgi:SAM-dependent methyltransferase